MRARIQDYWENISSSLWFVPGLLVMAAVLLSSVTTFVDGVFEAELRARLPFLFGGTADAARSLLSTVAGSLITVAALAFSVLIVALNQASAQFTPRVLRTFMGSRAYQIVLGSYIGTFTYALLVLRQIRSADSFGVEFIPSLAITTAILLTLMCLAMLVFFLHHSAQALQVSVILQQIHDETLQAIDRLYPLSAGDSAPEGDETAALRPSGAFVTSVLSTTAGYLRAVDEHQLFGVASPDIHLVSVPVFVGAYVPRGAVLAKIHADASASQECIDAIRGAMILGSDRTMTQDAMFGIRQTVDIALKALSPGINDPTTAEDAINHLGDVVGVLAARAFPARLRVTDTGPTRFWLERPSFADVANEAFAQIRRTTSQDVHVTLHFLRMLALVRGQVMDSQRSEIVCGHAHEVLAALSGEGFSTSDSERIREQARLVLG